MNFSVFYARWAIIAVLTAPLFSRAGQHDIQAPPGSGAFGSTVTLLPNGNFVVTDPEYDIPTSTKDVGAVYLYDGKTLVIISVLTGSNPGDRVGSDGLTVLSNGNFVVSSRNWNGGCGAVTGGSATAGVAGQVSAANSLIVGPDAQLVGSDSYGKNSVTALSNGNYLVRTPQWNDIRGAVTWGNGVSGTCGEISAANSLVGTRPRENVGCRRSGENGVFELKNGHYLVASGRWNDARGAVTWGNGVSGTAGEISAANSLVGSNAEEYVGDSKNFGYGSDGITLLGNGNYVVVSKNWDGNRGAVTWGNGTSGIAGEVSAANSLVGTTQSDQLMGTYIHELSNGNYVIRMPYWMGGLGAVTWSSGTAGVTGAISEGNSLVGNHSEDKVGGWNAITLLSNGHYVVASPYWNGERGAVTWGNGTTGVSGVISAANSLVGTAAKDQVGKTGVTALANGHYVVSSCSWHGGRGAVTWGDGMIGTSGEVSAANSLTGSAEGDGVGASSHQDILKYGITALSNGNFVISSSNWNDRRGAVTWVSGTGATSGVVSETNSLVGGSPEDRVGVSGVKALRNGNYVAVSPFWNESRGAATWGNGTSGVSGVISSVNSLTGGKPDDQVGANVNPSGDPESGVVTFTNGSYVVISNRWNGNQGAVTWDSGASALTGTVSAANSLVNGMAREGWGGGPGITEVGNGNFVVADPSWNGNRGAATWGSGATGISGEVSAANSLVGRKAGDRVGGAYAGVNAVTVLHNGNYVILSPDWNDSMGAVTWGSGMRGAAGEVSEVNSLVGTEIRGHADDRGIVPLKDGNYLMISRNAVTLSDGGQGASGAISAVNSVLGAGYRPDLTVAYNPAYPVLIASSPAGVAVFDFTPEISVDMNGLTVGGGNLESSVRGRWDFGGVLPDQGGVARRFTVRNTGMQPLHLTGKPVVQVTGAHAGDFTVTAQPGGQVESGSSADFTITFTPGGSGLRTAMISIASDDSDEPFYHFAVQGRRWTAIEIDWRKIHFAWEERNTGLMDDLDGDGVSNLLEFAFGTWPGNANSGPAPPQYRTSPTGDISMVAAGYPVTVFDADSGTGNPRVIFTRRKDFAAAGLFYKVQFSRDLLTWEESATAPEVLAEIGGLQLVSVPYPHAEPARQAGFSRVMVDIAP